MAMAVRNTTNPEELQIAVIHEIASLQGRSPSCDLVNNTSTFSSFVVAFAQSFTHICKADKLSHIYKFSHLHTRDIYLLEIKTRSR